MEFNSEKQKFLPYEELSKETNSFLIKNPEMDFSVIGLRVKRSLSKFPNARNLTTIVSKEVYNKMIREDMHRKIPTGIKYPYLKLNTIFDIILDYKDISELSQINYKESPAIPYFNSSHIIKPQQYFLSINKQFPDITKFFLSLKGGNPHLFSLIESDIRENGSKEKMFIPGS